MLTGNTFNNCNTVSATSDLGYAYIKRDTCSVYSDDYRSLLNEKCEEVANLEKTIKVLKQEMQQKKLPEITKIETPKENKVVIVHFSDGTKEKSVCDKDDKFSLETGIEVCVMKKIMGGNAAYNKYIKNAVKLYNSEIDRKNKEVAEKERKKAKIEKEKERRERRRERKIAEQIHIQKEAYLQAMNELKNH